MSETVHYRGNITELASGLKAREMSIKSIFADDNITDLPDWCDSWDEYICDYYPDRYIVINDRLYQVDMEEVGKEDIFMVKKTEDGYAFEVSYYNGGCSLKEALDIAIGEL